MKVTCLLSIAIIARNEEQYIDAALASAQAVADELVVLLDSRTTDATALIARSYTARVVYAPFVSFPAQRNHALALCHGQWVLFLDADERLTPELQQTLLQLKQHWRSQSDCYHGYWLPRYNRYWRWILRGGGWYPDYQLRLMLRTAATYDPHRLVHELVQINGEIGYLQAHLEHINIQSWTELIQKQHGYAKAEAQTLFHAGSRFKLWNIVLQPVREVWRRWWTWHGYRDGLIGLLLALVMGCFEAVKYGYLWFYLWRSHQSREPDQ